MKEPQISPIEFKKKMDSSQNKGLDILQVLKNAQESTDMKEKILKEVVDKLFDKNNLLMISRLDSNLAYYIVKHLIIDGFYSEYYYKSSYVITIKNKTEPPYYYPDIEYSDTEISQVMTKSYKKFISELLQVTISFKGQGRDELIKLYDAINERIRREESQSSFLKNLGLNKD